MMNNQSIKPWWIINPQRLTKRRNQIEISPYHLLPIAKLIILQKSSVCSRFSSTLSISRYFIRLPHLRLALQPHEYHQCGGQTHGHTRPHFLWIGNPKCGSRFEILLLEIKLYISEFGRSSNSVVDRLTSAENLVWIGGWNKYRPNEIFYLQTWHQIRKSFFILNFRWSKNFFRNISVSYPQFRSGGSLRIVTLLLVT